jgi:hypothetical protein
VLVYNNAAFDPELMAELGPAIGLRFQALSRWVRDYLKRGTEPPVPPDDLSVFLRMMALGWTELPATERRRVGPWELQLNPVRAFRPARAAGASPTGLYVPFDPSGFQFNKPFLRPETFWTGDFRGRRLDLLFNKFPFADLQTILVPDRESAQPQILTPADHELAWTLAAQIGESMPHATLGWNSLGAYASVNHLHFHLALCREPLAISDPRWGHNGGEQSYPLGCKVLGRMDLAWEAISELQGLDRPFNLIYTPGRVYCLARRRQGDYSLPDWCGGQAWYELAGGLVCFDAARYSELESAQVAGLMGLAAPGFDQYE